MKHTPLWKVISAKTRYYPELTQSIDVDVAIIGGGITGVTAAMELINSKKTVALIEAHQLGGMTTSHSTGNLYVPVQPLFQSIVTRFDEKTASHVAQARQMAIDYIEKNSQSGIECQFARRPWFTYFDNKANEDAFVQEIETIKKLGVGIEYTNQLPFNLQFHQAAVIPNQARFNPWLYVLSMAERLAAKGCLIHERTRALAIEEKGGCIVHTDKAKIRCAQVFMATHTPININAVQTFTAPYRSYVIGAPMKEAPDAQIKQFDAPHYSISTHALHNPYPEMVLVAGNHHKTGQENSATSRYHTLRTFLHEELAVAEVAHYWSAQHFQSADHIPYIGLASRHHKQVYMATGYFADGLVYGTLAGLLIADLISTGQNKINCFESTRTKWLASFGFWLKENVNVFGQYLSDLPQIAAKGYAEVGQGEGKILEFDREKWAVSRDDQDQVHVVSAVCTHMKCVVHWNDAEKTWDCPCHGSRFSPQGDVLEGPATRNLRPK
ncbi:FAD-dependent oxidoreductase [Legionella sp. MW5194]|uniref:FAD-dependent oxidoreductase n=1 Tax=Legionella sp. MW5194 TaxID=2662448 RepID=UPI00193D8DBD|nr:FAD-dependent oxidoreductase [Legionella sp. MW5194]QRN03288.1 FAD-dependent oxidoreductase [Legionella sp. MW5194]